LLPLLQLRQSFAEFVDVKTATCRPRKEWNAYPISEISRMYYAVFRPQRHLPPTRWVFA
jgi:hypothetical protein